MFPRAVQPFDQNGCVLIITVDLEYSQFANYYMKIQLPQPFPILEKMTVNAWKWPVLSFENLIKNYQYMYTYLVGDAEAIPREVVCVHLLESFFEGHASLNFHLVRITTVIEISAYCFTQIHHFPKTQAFKYTYTSTVESKNSAQK